MKLHNTTDYPDWFLRRLVSWCCKQLGLPVRFVRQAKFRKGGRTHARGSIASGRAWGSRTRGYFVVTHGYPGSQGQYAGHVLDDMIRTTVHEVAHLWLAYEGSRTRRSRNLGGSERQTNLYMRQVFEIFEANREALLAAWNEPPKRREAKPKPTLQETRAKVASDALVRWQRKLKLAQTKVRQYRQKARYYERALAAKGK